MLWRRAGLEEGMMTEATGWPSELSEPAPPEPEAEAVPPELEAEAEVEAEPEPTWLVEVRNNVGGIVGTAIEVRNNVGGIVGTAIEELYNLVTGG
jgi:hypothetical protein